MSSENLIHIKLEYGEALESKKDILSSEMALLEIMKAMKRYKVLRLEELKIKLKLYNRIKSLTATLRKLHLDLPKLHIPGILQRGKEEIKEKHVEMPHDESLENQLQEIKDKLRSIGS